MKTICLDGRITEDGKLDVELPGGLPPGEARVTIEIGSKDEWTREALSRALAVEPLTGAEIVAAGLVGGWEEQGISNGVAWVEAQRRKRREQRGW